VKAHGCNPVNINVNDASHIERVGHEQCVVETYGIVLEFVVDLLLVCDLNFFAWSSLW
jgi:hypothetical protein